MSFSASNLYDKIAILIDSMRADLKELNLNILAEKVNLNPKEIERTFQEWAGIGVTEFWKYIPRQQIKKNLNQAQPSLFDSIDQDSKIANSRIHESFVEIIEMKSETLKNGLELTIDYSFNNTRFGQILIASTSLGICYLGFADEPQTAFSELKKRFPKANYISKSTELHQNTLLIFESDWSKIEKIKLHLQGTDFQIQVWKMLLQIPTAQLTSYGELAKQIQKPKAARAVGTAIGSNPIAFLIPCHRVVQTTGALGGYMWGETRKIALIAWENSQK